METNQNIKKYDDYDWDHIYPFAHYQQTKELEKDYAFELSGSFSIIDGKIKTNGKPLHPNAQFLYEKVIELQPKTIFEVGFGYCNHLLSINKLLENVILSGCDISSHQFSNALRRYGSELKNLIQQKRIFLSIGDFLEIHFDQKYDLVYSQAVVMHLSTEKAMKAIEKMCSISNKYVLCLDGGLIIPNIREWLLTLGKVTFFDEFAAKYWSLNYISPFIIEK